MQITRQYKEKEHVEVEFIVSFSNNPFYIYICVFFKKNI